MSGHVSSLDLAELEAMDDETFARRYGGYAFAWRGKQPLVRNLRLKK